MRARERFAKEERERELFFFFFFFFFFLMIMCLFVRDFEFLLLVVREEIFFDF